MRNPNAKAVMPFVLVGLIACSKAHDSGPAAKAHSSPASGPSLDPCTLLQPGEIEGALGCKAAPGTHESGTALCHWDITGAPPGSPAPNEHGFVEVSYVPSIPVFAKDHAINKGMSLVDVPELAPDAYLRVDGFLFMNVRGGGLTINIHSGKYVGLGNAEGLAARKPDVAKLASLVRGRLAR